MKLLSSAFKQGEKIPRKYTCQGEEISPPLEIHNVPEAAKSLALIMDDPDVPEWVRKERMYDHWVLYNIPPTTTTIPENVQNFATLGKTTKGSLSYVGPCPPNGEHRYFFKLFALDKELKLEEGLSKNEFLKAIEGHILTECELMGTYVKT